MLGLMNMRLRFRRWRLSYALRRCERRTHQLREARRRLQRALEAVHD